MSQEDQVIVILEDSGQRLVAPKGASLLEVLQKFGLPIRSDCGGKGKCGKCRIVVAPSDSVACPTSCELELLPKEDLERGLRLACQCEIRGNVVVRAEEEVAEEGLGSVKTALGGSYPSYPAVRRVVLEATEGKGKVPERDLLGMVLRRIARTGLPLDAMWDVAALRDLSEPRILEGNVTLVWHRQKGITGLRRGAAYRGLGLALDLGTTTIAGYLCDLEKGEIVSSASITNPQGRFGEDVISRIAYASDNPRGCKILQELAVKAVNSLMDTCLRRVGSSPEELDEIVVVGNTTMLEIFAGMNPHSLGRAPYLPLCLSPLDLRSGDLGLKVPPGTNVHFFPVISGFVGGDALAAIISQGLHEEEEPTLLIDIGTNGELVLGNRDFLWATSCATGPALEGAHLSCGMRATRGAIWKVWQERGKLEFQVLGPEGESPRGICGSGVIDTLAALLSLGILLPSGRFVEGKEGVVHDDRGVGTAFQLVKKGERGAKRNIYISLKDVRQVQLAKAAMYVGVKFLMKRAGLSEVRRLVLTGAFGARFNWRSAVDIGMIPPEATRGEVRTVENAAGLGAVMALLDSRKRDEAKSIAQKVQVVELAEESDFSSAFCEALEFPGSPLELDKTLEAH